MRILLVIHRYLAVAVGLVMALWCLSGFVMIYQPYPEFTAAERLATLAPLQLHGCCRTDFLPQDDAPAGGFRVEMLNGSPVLRRPGVAPIDLAGGVPLPRLMQDDVLQVAGEYARRRGIVAMPRWLQQVRLDQWSIQSAGRNQPAQHVALDDASGTELYINGRTGEIFQQTERRERVLGWLGAIPHWLYPTVLRRNGALWSQVVIWTSVVGTFLTLTGLYVGISRLRRRRGGESVSPFRGWWYWHHVSGLVFGVLTLTWVFSGLLTMNPWGLFEGSGVGAQLQPRLAGEPPVAELRQFLRAVSDGRLQGEFAQLRAQPFGGRLFVVAYRADGSAVRLDAAGQSAPLGETDVRAVLAGIGTPVASFESLRDGDAYYYGYRNDIELPVYRAILADAQRTRLYISPTTGSTRVVDRDARSMRWLEGGLHQLDFPGLQSRPLWDCIMLLLLAGVTVSCVTGSWLAIQRVRRDVAAVTSGLARTSGSGADPER